MTDTLILLFHPDLSRSRANAALAAAAKGVPGVTIVDMQALYPSGIDMERDGEREAARLIGAGRIVLQFPMQWYAPPPLLKAWQDAVLTWMMYLHPETEGRALADKPFKAVVTAGNTAEAYRAGGRNLFTVEALLAPLRATTNRCGLVWTEAFAVYEANALAPEALAEAASRYAAVLAEWHEARREAVQPVTAEA